MPPSRDRRPLRVLHVLVSFGTGGTEQGVINLINHSDPDRVRFGVVSFEPHSDAESLARVRNEDFFYRPLDKKFGNDPRVVLRLRRTLREGRFDIMHSHGWPTFLESRFAVVFKRRLGVLHGEHGTSHLEQGRRRSAFSLLHGGFHRFLFVSERLKREFIEKTRIPPERMQVIANGVDFDRFRPEGTSLRDGGDGFEPGILHVGTAGRLHPVKGHRILLRLALASKRGGDPVRVHFAGDGPLRREYEEFIRQNDLQDHVTLHGSLRRIEEYYRSLDLFVLPSRHEGHPNCVLEAVASGCLVASTPVGDLPEFVRSGENGFLFEHGDLEALREIVALRIREPERCTGIARAGFDEARERFTLQRMTENYTRAYEEIFDRHVRG